MKTEQQINEARKKVAKTIVDGQHSLTDDQITLLSGMLNALVWVADGPDCSTMDRLLAGEEIAIKK